MICTNTFTTWLEQFINFERTPKKDILNLKKMQVLAEYFGNPHQAYKTIHVAGSKGKGSTATLISCCFRAAGFKTGLYTSPHVIDFRERITLSGDFFSDEAYAQAYQEVIEGFERLLKEHPDIEPTWFEIVTLLSFILFRNEKVDYAIFEVGLGGRLDTTNIINPVACAILPIELEHCKYLGNTIEQIASEKAGIIKEGVPVFCFEQKSEALTVFQAHAAEKNAPLFYLPDFLEQVDSTISLDGQSISIHYKPNTTIGALFYEPLQTTLRLLDPIQAKNASLVVALVKYCNPNIENAHIEKGLHAARLFARFEVLHTEPLIVIDGAHTENSLRLTVQTFQNLTTKKGLLVFACAEDKPSDILAQVFENKFDTIYLTIPGSFKKSNFAKLTQDFTAYFDSKNSRQKIVHSDDYTSVIEQAINEGLRTKTPVLITGSFYLAGEAKQYARSRFQ